MAKKRTRPEVRIASPDEATRFINRLQEEFPIEPRSKADKERLRKYLADNPKETLRSIMRRALTTMVQHPAPPQAPAPASDKRPPQDPAQADDKRTRRKAVKA